MTLSGRTSTVAWVHTVHGQADYYNLTVANVHTYAVGTGDYVVHNVCIETWRKVKTLSNTDTLDQFKAKWSACDFCGETFRPGDVKVIEHAYPRDVARPYLTNQADYDIFIKDVDNLGVTCRGCNSAQGTRFPGTFTVPRETLSGFKGGGYVQRLLGRIAIMSQRYGLPGSW